MNEFGLWCLPRLYSGLCACRLMHDIAIGEFSTVRQADVGKVPNVAQYRDMETLSDPTGQQRHHSYGPAPSQETKSEASPFMTVGSIHANKNHLQNNDGVQTLF